ncbi:MAG: hypothetical protein WA485_26075 [Candidatus Sulfotelmatobacter sp.]
MRVGRNLAVWIALSSAFSPLLNAQQNTPASDSGSPAQAQPADTNSKQDSSKQKPSDTSQPTKPSIEEVGAGKVAGTSNDRLFYTLPNFLTLQGREKLPPLSTKDKFKVVALGTFDYFEYPWWGILAAINQAQNNEPGYGQGWVGYAKRYGSTAGDSMVENFMVGAVFPSVLHQDPRFYQSGGGSFFKRSGYAVSRIVITRGDSGHHQFNFSEVFGAAVAAGISTYSYHPRSTFLSTRTNPHKFIGSDRTLSSTISTWETQMGLDAVTIVVKEFWPDIHRKISHKSKAAIDTSDQH